MEKLKAKPMQVGKFLIFWMLAVYLLYPLMIIPTSIAIYLLPPYPSYERLETIYWNGLANQVLFVLAFTVPMAFVQAWLFKRLLYIRISHWEIATICGGFIGAALMWFYHLNSPFEMLTWFLGIGIAQMWLLRSRVKNAWLWLFAQICLSLFFPIYDNDWLFVVLKWLVASSIYGVATLLVLRELAQDFVSITDATVS